MLGRDESCDVRIDSRKVSSEHASLHWTNGSWELRDLGSRNGTYLAGRRLAAGERAPLELGSTFSLSRSAAVFELVDASPPAAAALHRESGTWHYAEAGLLPLPNEEAPAAILYTTSEGVWNIEIDDSARAVVDGEVITAGGDSFQLEIPAPDVDTLQSDEGGPQLDSIRLEFGVTPDEEEVALTVAVAGASHRLPPRRYHYLLVTLARAWIADEGVPLSVRGWVDRDELCKKLEVNIVKLNVEIHRARKQIAALGVQNAAALVERRPGTYEIRIGVHNLVVARA